MTRLSRIARNGAVVALGLLLAAGAGELVLRSFWPQRSSVTIGMFESDPHAGYRLRSGYRNFVRVPEYRTEIRTDAGGFRVPAEETPGRAPTFRALAIGDSFTFGVGVDAEDAFPAVLEARLDRASSGEWAVDNGGVGGFGPLRSARLLFSSQGSRDPDLLVHAFYVGNDLEDSNPVGLLDDPRIEAGRMITAGQKPLMTLRLYLRTRSHLYSFLRSRLYGLYRASGLAEKSQYLDPVGLREWTPWITQTSWPAAQTAMREIASWCRERGTEYLVVVLPTRYQVDEHAWRRYREAWGLPSGDFDRDHAQREVIEFLSSAGIPALDLLPEFRRETGGGARLYYDFDRHWTADGHRLAARLIHEKLEELGWISSTGVLRRDVVHADLAADAG